MDKKKNILFIFLLVLLFLPLLQQKSQLIPVKGLTGEGLKAFPREFSWTNWTDGSFQAKFEAAVEDHIGFRPWVIRFKNQLEFLLFRKANAIGVRVEKKGYLFETDYLRAYSGEDYLGDWFWDQKFQRLEMLRDTLQAMGIELAVVIEPGKASFYPEYIRKRHVVDHPVVRNYDQLIAQSGSRQIPLLDLNALFIQEKSSSPYPLFPKTGIHWSAYGMIRAVDTLLDFANQLVDKSIPDLRITELTVSKNLMDTDNDLADIMNLMWTPSHDAMAYPEFVIDSIPMTQRAKVLSVSDSFFFNIINAGILKKSFANEAFWYYSNTIYPETWTARKDTSMVNIREEVEKMDLILLMPTERFYYKFAWNFIDHLYKEYYRDEVPNLLYDYFGAIIRNFEWFDLVHLDALSREVSMESALRDHAFYQFWQDEQDGKLKKDAAYFVMKMRKDPDWFSKIAEKARMNGIDVERQLVLDGLWMENQEQD